MKTTLVHYILPLILFVPFSCKKDEFLVKCENCEKNCSNKEISPPDFRGYVFSNTSNFCIWPTSQPLNQEYLIYYLNRDENHSMGRLMKMKLADKSTVEIFSGELMNRPCWSSNGWLLLNSKDANIWKMKDNGDSLQLLFTGNNNYSPKCSYDGTKIIFQKEIIGQGYSLIADFNGTILDTTGLIISGGGSSWANPEGLLAFGLNFPKTGFALATPMKDMNIEEFNIEIKDLVIFSCMWSDDFLTMYLGTNFGLFTYCFLTGEVICKRKPCDFESYSDLVPNGNHGFFSSRTHCTYIGNSTFMVSSEIVEIPFDCSTEKSIVP